MKKLFAILLALAMAFALVACGGGEEAKTPVDGQNAAAGKDKDFALLEVEESKRKSDLAITEMKLSKETYKVGEEISLTLQWTGTPESSAWVGVVPADVPHGDEYVNDDADIEYIYLADHEGSTFVFTTALEPGDYTLRVNDYDDGGAELAWCAFKVK